MGRVWMSAVPLLAVLAAAAAGSATAQERERAQTRERDEQREEREERCVCVATPHLHGFAFQGPGWARSRARLGVQVAMSRNPETDNIGARIADVVAGSPAAEAGLEEGDVIVSVNGRSLLEPLEDEELDEDESAPAQRLVALARRLEPGDTARIVYRRGDERREATVIARRVKWPELEVRTFRFRVPELPHPPQEPPRILKWRWREGEPSTFLWPGTRGPILGIQVVNLNPGLGEYFGAQAGVLVTEVEGDAPLPVRAGDVILRVGEREIRDQDHLRRILQSYRPDETISLEILRKRERMTVEGRAR